MFLLMECIIVICYVMIVCITLFMYVTIYIHVYLIIIAYIYYSFDQNIMKSQILVLFAC